MMTAIIVIGWVGMALWISFGKPLVAVYDRCWLFLLGLTIGHIVTHQ